MAFSMMFVSRKENPPVISRKGRILCTEDDPDTRDLIVLVLSQHGFDVMCADDADEAIKLAKTQNFDLYLLDNWMPALSGQDLTKKLREFDVKTPILFYSGAAYERDKEAARSSGAQGYLVKAADSDQLTAEVVRLIAESRIAKPATFDALASVGSDRSTKGK